MNNFSKTLIMNSNCIADLIAFLETQNENDHKFSTYYVDSNTSVDDAVRTLKYEKELVEKYIDDPSFILNNFNAIINSLLARDKTPEHGLVYFTGNGIFIEYRPMIENDFVTRLSTQGIYLEPLKEIISKNTKRQLLDKMKKCPIEWCGERNRCDPNKSEPMLCEDCEITYTELQLSEGHPRRLRRQSATLTPK